jgi:hypothetical protein
MVTEEDIAANLEDFLFSLEVWLKLYDLSLVDFYEWEDNLDVV